MRRFASQSARRRISRRVHGGLKVAIILAAGVAGASALATGGAFALGYRVNTTASMPLGVWRVDPHATVGRGDVAWVCPPNSIEFRTARRYGFVPTGFCEGNFTPLLKPVAAVAGDTVDVSPEGVWVNGRLLPNTVAKRVDGAGRLLPLIPQREYVVRPGQVWLLSTYHPASFDSRYFGPVPVAGVQGKATPAVLWGPNHD